MTKTYTLAEQKENRKKWAKALRSGRYKQGRSWLRNGEAHCCLGVACRIFRVPGFVDEECLFWQYDGEYETAPQSVINTLGLNTETGECSVVIWPSFHFSLTAANDYGATFSEIADIIESEPKGLFRESVEEA